MTQDQIDAAVAYAKERGWKPEPTQIERCREIVRKVRPASGWTTYSHGVFTEFISDAIDAGLIRFADDARPVTVDPADIALLEKLAWPDERKRELARECAREAEGLLVQTVLSQEHATEAALIAINKVLSS